MGDLDCSDGKVTGKCIDLINKWKANELNNVEFVLSKVTSIKEGNYESSIYFNDDNTKQLSLSEQILMKIDNEFVFKSTPDIKIGDIMISHSDQGLIEIPINSINILEKETKAFLFYREPYGLIIAGDSLAYNGCPIHMLTN